MMYQCVHCKVTYHHDQSYKHNVYDCPRVKGKTMKAWLIGLLALSMVGLTGCDVLKNLLPQDKYPVNANKVELIFYQGDKVFKYQCEVNLETKALSDCREVK